MKTRTLVSIVVLIFSALIVAVNSFAASNITVYFEENAQVELISSKRTRVLIDICDPSLLSRQATKKDILLTTHTHPDHINSDFLLNFEGKQLFVRIGEIKAKDVSIQGIASAHNEGDPFLPENGTNYIFIVDMGDLRIVHFGDIGQEAFTAEQLATLGKVDLAVMQFDNTSFSKMTADNKKGFNLMAQIRPRLIIPTHNSPKAAEVAMTLWPCLYSDKPSVKISRKILTDETRILFLGDLAPAYAEITNASAVDW
ncbi:MAG: MBL fold metallo-hydrolase [Spirochaetota bacterium]|nr:MAG: MBL fold metallo-hydrolase [Spirochaetota bacterium]